MSERRQRSTRLLSRETVQIMLEMKSLLRKYGIAISLTAPDVHDLMIQAAETIDDEQVATLRQRLMAAKTPTRELPVTPTVADEENPFVDDNEESEPAAPVFTMPSVASNGSSAPMQHLPPLDMPKLADHSVRDVYIQGPFVEDEINVFLESGETPRPTTKRVVLNTPRTGLLRCDRCQRTTTVRAAASSDQAVEMTCACGATYRVLVDSRKYDRKLTNLPGFYVDQQDDKKTGTIVVENVSLGSMNSTPTTSKFT